MNLLDLSSKLAEIEERRALALSASLVGIWDWDVKNKKLIFDAGMFDIYGIDPKKFKGTYEDWVEALHPDDRKYAEAAVQKCLNDPSARYFYRFRVKHQKKWRVVSGIGNCIRDNNGIPVRMVGINILEPEPCPEHNERFARNDPCETCPSRWATLYGPTTPSETK